MTEMSDKEQKVYDTKRVRAFGDLVRLEGWQMYVDLLNTYITEKGSQLMEPLSSDPNAAARQEYVKGAMYGLSLARDVVSITIKTAKEQRAPSEEEKEDA
jgi:hypothetical protein